MLFKMFVDMALIDLTLLISYRSDGKDEKSEGEGKDGKGEKCGIISSLHVSIKR